MKDETAILELPRLDQHQGGRCYKVERHLFGEDDVHITVSVFNQVHDDTVYDIEDDDGDGDDMRNHPQPD